VKENKNNEPNEPNEPVEIQRLFRKQIRACKENESWHYSQQNVQLHQILDQAIHHLGEIQAAPPPPWDLNTKKHTKKHAAALFNAVDDIVCALLGPKVDVIFMNTSKNGIKHKQSKT